jgi:transcriptional regulator with XRE-family HTH domain
MPPISRARSARPARRARKAARTLPAAASTVPLPVLRIAKELRRWTDTVLGIAASATDFSLNLAGARARGPRQQAAIRKAGSMLRQARKAAGITTQELARAIDLADPELIARAEVGKAALPFEVILRLAGVLGRHDPVTFVMKLARSYYPPLWRALDDLGIGRLAVQVGRERELANVYRANDDARKLSDAEFTAVLGFVKAGFDMAVSFHGATAGGRGSPRARRARR